MRAWEILEKDKDSMERDYRDSRYGKRMSMRDHEDKLEKLVDEIYECGFEDGYRKAHEESDSYGERSSYRRMR